MVCPWIRSSTECQTIVSTQIRLNTMRLKQFWSDRIKTRINSNANTIPHSIMLENRYKGHFRVMVFRATTYSIFFHVVYRFIQKNGRRSRFGSFTMANEHWILQVLPEALKVKCTLAHTCIPGRQKRWSATQRIIAFQIINAGYFHRSINFKNGTRRKKTTGYQKFSSLRWSASISVAFHLGFSL